jgi:hypothetical protein
MLAVLFIGSAGWWLLSAAAGAANLVMVQQLQNSTLQLQCSISLLHCQQHPDLSKKKH